MSNIQTKILRDTYGDEANFKTGQEEAIQALLDKKRVLVIQKTGWGKSIVYFIATKVFRNQGFGLSIVVSPLLALMNDQINSASEFGLVAETVNTNNQDEWDNVYKRVKSNEVDILFISPERLANDDFVTNVLNRVTSSISMLVIDEAHCISDWGHDFRPDYRRIKNIVRFLPRNVPILATTATANKRVEEDIQVQLGEDLVIQRGELTRESLAIQVLKLSRKEERLAWISDNFKLLGGSGVVYCLTRKDCDLVTTWLNNKGINAKSYYGGIDRTVRMLIEDEFMNNKIDVLVATSAYGMGVDKRDIHFIIHFQKPGNPIAYYQQIGRAGRGIESAYAILMSGAEDDYITQYFIESAFPSLEQMEEVLNIIEHRDGIKKWEFAQVTNMSQSTVEHCLKFLILEKVVAYEKKLYIRTVNPWSPSKEESVEITKIREQELIRMNDFVNSSECYMKFMADELDDPKSRKCGKCSNCVGALLPEAPVKQSINEVERFLKDSFYIIEPRKKWPTGVRHDDRNVFTEGCKLQKGKVLSNYGDVAYGRSVANGKYVDGYFSDELVDASVALLKDWVVANEIKWVTYVPSLRRPHLVEGFAIRVADKLNLTCYNSIQKLSNAEEQKTLNNSYSQYENAWNSFDVSGVKDGNVLLIDDMVDSRWTMTVCGYKLIKSGSGMVFPFALSNSAGGK